MAAEEQTSGTEGNGASVKHRSSDRAASDTIGTAAVGSDGASTAEDATAEDAVGEAVAAEAAAAEAASSKTEGESAANVGGGEGGEEGSAAVADEGGDGEVGEERTKPANHTSDRGTFVDQEGGADGAMNEGPAMGTAERAVRGKPVEEGEAAVAEEWGDAAEEAAQTFEAAEAAEAAERVEPVTSLTRPHTPSLGAAREDWADEERASTPERFQTINYGHYKKAFPVSKRGYIRWRDIDGGLVRFNTMLAPSHHSPTAPLHLSHHPPPSPPPPSPPLTHANNLESYCISFVFKGHFSYFIVRYSTVPKCPGSTGKEVPKFTGSLGQDASQHETFFWVGTNAGRAEAEGVEGEGEGEGDAGAVSAPTHSVYELEVTECAVAGLAIPTRPGGFKSRDLEVGGRTAVSINTPRKEGCSCLFGNPCQDRYVCENWNARFEVAKANGWNGYS